MNRYLTRPDSAGVLLRGSIGLVLGWAAAYCVCEAATYPVSAGQSVIGQLQKTRIKSGETLPDIARRYGVALSELKNINRSMDVWLPAEGREVIVPTLHLLPPGPREGIVINLPELRLYYFPPAAPGRSRVVMTYPLGIGSEGRTIPLMDSRITEVRSNPPWLVPDSIRAEHRAEGDPLPEVVPPGADNPLGRYTLRLGETNFLIHGTNRPYSVGMRISHGCLRMYPEDIEELHGSVEVGTPVRIVDEPYKAGWHGRVLYIEVHHPLIGNGSTSDMTSMVKAVVNVVNRPLDERVWWNAIFAARQKRGIPMAIFRRR